MKDRYTKWDLKARFEGDVVIIPGKGNPDSYLWSDAEKLARKAQCLRDGHDYAHDEGNKYVCMNCGKWTEYERT